MGNDGAETPKNLKPASTQEQPPSSPATVYPEWASFQAYYNSAGAPIAPPAFFHSPVPSSPQSHPYMWGQHMIPPYGVQFQNTTVSVQNVKAVFDAAIKVVLQPPKQKKNKKRKAQKSCSIL